MDEKTMARALGLTSRPAGQGQHKMGKLSRIAVVLAVRRMSSGTVYGKVLKFVRAYTTVSAVEAEHLAKKEARAEGFAVWHVLEVERE